MAVTGTPSSGDDTLTGDGADDTIVGQQGNDSIFGGGGNDIVYGDVQYLVNALFISDQANDSWSAGTVDGWYNTGSGGTIERWGNGFLGYFSSDGTNNIELDGNTTGLDHIQTDLDLDTGVSYTITVRHAARSGTGVNDDFEITHNGVVVATVSPTLDWGTTTVTITGLAGTDTIGLRELASQDDSLGIVIDSVTISLDPSEVAGGSFTYDDTIDGGSGADTIFGQEGDDRIIGGAGDDLLIGGIGNDDFVFADGSGSDIIEDLVIGEDMLDVTGMTDVMGDPVEFDDIAIASDGQGGSILTFPNGEQIQLVGIEPEDIDTRQEAQQIGIPCFLCGTRIETANGPANVEDLEQGDGLLCLGTSKSNNFFRPVKRVFRRRVELPELLVNPRLWPVRIKQGALGQGLPRTDLLVSRQHRVLVDSEVAFRMTGSRQVLVPAVALIGLPGIGFAFSGEDLEYFHILLDDHQVIFANGVPAESLFIGQEALKAISTQARKEILSLFPELSIPGFAPASVRQALNGRKARKLVARHAKNGHPILAKPLVAQKLSHAKSDKSMA